MALAAVAGGPERWRVISVCAGGRHNLALALPDNDTSSLPPRPMSRASSTQPPDLHHLPPGEPLDGAVDRNGDQEEDPTEANDDDLMADGEFGEGGYPLAISCSTARSASQSILVPRACELVDISLCVCA